MIDVATIGSGVLAAIYELAVLIPSLAVAVRRPHDTDRSGGWLANKYGENPKLVPAAA
ncbi:DUF805 domain-containing protein [Streptomyces sp. SS1-1]|uniref:DUF805 domain-containing protein n=1 Tax=Streptomyces sp. SS1-1 TaxID=2651869 RepID=UPI0012507B96|nr:DUF805 domain-containing protein [Streptomyces sp. SS1-1]KAB2974744.1 DUF805 domain-containing protein [Streptomyces sp. SS1-1]